MSNPYASPEPSPQDSGDGWSSQSTTPPQPGQTPTGQPAYPQGGQQGTGQAWGAGPQQTYAQPPYGAVYAQQAQVDQIRSNSTVILVLGILGLVVIGLFGSIPAWIWGSSTIRRAQEMGLPANLYQNANIGKILGIIGTVLWAIVVAFFVLFIILAIAGATAYDSTGGFTTILSLLARP